MAAVSTLQSIAVKLILNNGTSPTGAVKTVSVNLGNINKDTYDVDKALNIVTLIAGVLSKDMTEVREVKTGKLTNQ